MKEMNRKKLKTWILLTSECLMGSSFPGNPSYRSNQILYFEEEKQRLARGKMREQWKRREREREREKKKKKKEIWRTNFVLKKFFKKRERE